jgi:Amt family ammonium transporter
MYIFFKLVSKTGIGLRSSDADQLAGLDIPEMGVHGYVD